jgi:hypothetical protein
MYHSVAVLPASFSCRRKAKNSFGRSWQCLIFFNSVLYWPTAGTIGEPVACRLYKMRAV